MHLWLLSASKTWRSEQSAYSKSPCFAHYNMPSTIWDILLQRQCCAAVKLGECHEQHCIVAAHTNAVFDVLPAHTSSTMFVPWAQAQAQMQEQSTQPETSQDVAGKLSQIEERLQVASAPACWACITLTSVLKSGLCLQLSALYV